MTTAIDMGTATSGKAATMDLEELLASRLLVQGNSGSGKSHLLRRLLEQSAGSVQQVVIDPEGDFVTLAERFGHLVIDAADYSEAEAASIAARVRAQRASVVLNLEQLEVYAQLRCAGVFLNRLFDAPREHWHPVLVVVDEAQLFAPAAAGDVGEEARRVSLGAMTNLMCRGRKRGLAGVIATQRLAKLAKNVAAEASNFLMGRTFLDIDMARAADLLGMERRQAEQIRDLARGQFLALGPALARRPLLVTIGAVETGSRGAGPALRPLPAFSQGDRDRFLSDAVSDTTVAVSGPVATRQPVEQLLARLDEETAEPPPTAAADLFEAAALDPAPIITAVLRDIVEDEELGHRAPGALQQDFAARCRMRGLTQSPLGPEAFGRALAAARAGLYPTDMDEPGWQAALRVAADVPGDMLGVFLLLAHAAREEAPCPSDAEIARVYGTQSPRRARRLMEYLEGRHVIAMRTDLRGRRSVAIPSLGWTSAAEEVGVAA
ncbi:AAA family ATPase [uncultured Sphingomonas sp.]|uniref:AAA family ATPase n=1 Tax=uncultured Sphingomonas sp. TaxID=158754 RepID=UPI0035C9723C